MDIQTREMARMPFESIPLLDSEFDDTDLSCVLPACNEDAGHQESLFDSMAT